MRQRDMFLFNSQVYSYIMGSQEAVLKRERIRHQSENEILNNVASRISFR